MQDIDFNYTEPKQSFLSHAVEFIQTLAVFAAIGAAIYYFVSQPHKVSGPSMIPTFQNGDYILTDKVTYHFREPEKGDIVVFKNPRDESQDFIKRIMAVPGDKIKVENQKVYINGALFDEPYISPYVVTDSRAFLNEGEEYTVEQNQYLVFGDNRPQSADSREWGPITKEEIIGKVFFRYWPMDSFGFINYKTNYQTRNTNLNKAYNNSY